LDKDTSLYTLGIKGKRIFNDEIIKKFILNSKTTKYKTIVEIGDEIMAERAKSRNKFWKTCLMDKCKVFLYI